MLTSSGRVRAISPVLCAVLLLGAAGCGGGSSSTSTSSSAATAAKTTATGGTSTIKAPTKVALQAGLLGDQASAGEGESYDPTGAIVADSGFRPDVDGFAFENYGNDAGPINLKPANVEDVFGSQVCAAGEGATCKLIPAAEEWRRQLNESMAGGHCMGFSVTALRFFAKDISQTPYGAATTIGLPVQGNRKLQSLIAEDFAYQALPAVTDKTIGGSPVRVLSALVKALRTKTETYTLGIFKADGTGGHAITPFAVEDKGNGIAEILVYDNNFPGVIRKVDVNTKTDQWRYIGGINPSDTDELYEGDARTQSMSLLPTTPGTGQQPCPFCPKSPGKDPAYPLPDKLKYIEVHLRGRTANHPRLLFKDEQGRRTGYVGGRFIREIPGIKVIQDFSVQNWQDGPEPRYHLPVGHPQYIVTVDGTSLKKEAKTRITLNGSGIVFFVNDLTMEPGQKDTMILPAKDLGLAYLSGRPKYSGSVTLGAQFLQYDKAGQSGRGDGASITTLAVGWAGFRPGDPLQFLLKPDRGTVQVASTGGQRVSGDAGYFIDVNSLPVVGGKAREYFGSVKGVKVEDGQGLNFRYLRPTRKTLPVDIVSRAGDTLQTVQLPTKK